MKTLLIAYYWHPWNNSGTFRWVGMAPFIDCDVLTSRVPVKSWLDDTVPKPDKRVYRFGFLMPAKIWGLIAPLFVLFSRYKTVIISSPPETLVIWAYLLQRLGYNVLLDMRDSIDRKAMLLKFMRPIYRHCIDRVRKVVVAWQFIEPSRPVVYHGHDSLERGSICSKDYRLLPRRRLRHSIYNYYMSIGYMPDFRTKPDGYACSSVHNVIHLGFRPNSDRLHPEVYTVTPVSWEESANKIKALL